MDDALLLSGTAVENAVGWLLLAASLLVPGAIAALLWTPFLLSSRIRTLFVRLPPSGSLLPSYALVGVAASLPFVLGPLVAVTRAGPDALWGPAILGVTAVLFVGYAAGTPLVGALALPRLGIDWDPHGYDASTWALLGAGGAWYAALFAVPLAVLGLVLSLPGGY
ncbi:hypothetical protein CHINAEXTREME_18030 [Halobiforma lacisalsi AJ5]|uniref:DUF8162 domain-containing protein n=1 Tax=Natronobacterium lacisalsi AJ5 TaxID=358396 RepID=M0LEZ2_NATLA|nr:hypothetical protein [Halobiforma lacisalsi]APW99552.1 hypothetical protein CHINAEXTREME_18030 [Halobiforma lacisalsi AJ5]EMA31678.1 hypothetical protein C445_14387 [Halobiforma lacisalsi AJ5]